MKKLQDFINELDKVQPVEAEHKIKDVIEEYEKALKEYKKVMQEVEKA